MSGCESKKELIRERIPPDMLRVPSLETRECKTNAEASIFMLEIYEAYEQCSENLKSIERWNNGLNN